MGDNKERLVLVTGVTGYVGGRLVPVLLAAGYRVRVMVRRNAERLDGRTWSEQVEVVVGDVLAPETLPEVLAGVDSAYYLIHSMRSGEEFRERDRQAARNFGKAAEQAGVRRIIYLGGLGDNDDTLSEHLRSRQETGEILREYGVPVTEFRAAVIVGSGSVSFEMVRHLAERLPVMIAPRWLATRIQPIAIGDVLAYLVAAVEEPGSAGEIIEIGGATVLTYGEMLLEYAEVRGLRRWIIPVPVLTPALSSYWVHWVTPIPADIAQPLIKGLSNEVVAETEKAAGLFPEIEPLSYRAAVRQALARLQQGDIETIWSDAQASSQGDRPPVRFTQEQGMYIERRRKRVAAPPALVFRAFAGLGGQQGWPPYHWLWEVRGALDRLVGGVGLRRGRRHPDDVRVGEALDFWRVEAVEPGRLLRLRAEMRVPGRAWLQFEARPGEEGKTELIQTAYFDAHGLAGLLYWYGVYPFHGPVFSQMIGYVARRAEALARGEEGPATPGERGRVWLWPVLVGAVTAILLWWKGKQAED